MKFSFLTLFLALSLAAGVSAEEVSYHDTLPSWLLPLREAVFGQNVDPQSGLALYNAARGTANGLSGTAKLNGLAWCDYYMGRIYQDNKQDDEAIKLFNQGLDTAEQSVKLKETAEGWALMSSNLGQLCMLKSTFWVMAHGLDVVKYADKAVSLDPKCAPALYNQASRYVFSPSWLADEDKGIKMLMAMLNGGADLQKSDLFNVYTALAWAYIEKEDAKSAAPYLAMAHELYPTSRFVNKDLTDKLAGLK
jgi:tetratricopeptide (TPR) repeat protein